MTTTDAIEFCMRHRSKAFTGWSREHIELAVMEGLLTGTMFYCIRDDQIEGVAITEPHPQKRRLHIVQLVCSRKGVLPKFIRAFVERFPGWSLSAERRGRLVHYDTPRFLRKAMTYG